MWSNDLQPAHEYSEYTKSVYAEEYHLQCNRISVSPSLSIYLSLYIYNMHLISVYIYIIYIYICDIGTLWLFNLAMENGTFIDGLPSYKMVIFHGYVSHNQRVN